MCCAGSSNKAATRRYRRKKVQKESEKKIVILLSIDATRHTHLPNTHIRTHTFTLTHSHTRVTAIISDIVSTSMSETLYFQAKSVGFVDPIAQLRRISASSTHHNKERKNVRVSVEMKRNHQHNNKHSHLPKHTSHTNQIRVRSTLSVVYATRTMTMTPNHLEMDKTISINRTEQQKKE